MSLRIGFDLDGTIADLDGAMSALADKLFPQRAKSPSSLRQSQAGEKAAEPAAETAAATAVEDAGTGDPEGADKDVEAAMDHARLTARQHQSLWKTIRETENFWETLEEHEPGSVRRLGRLAAERRWEVVFLTQRPGTAGDTAQVQTQRWLMKKGFPVPSVFVVPAGRRGRIAGACDLHIIVDDRPDNCLDVNVDSRARAILVWRGDPANPMMTNAKRLGIGVVTSINACLDAIVAAEDAALEAPSRGLLSRLRRFVGLG
jgi:hypothetical protein